MARGFENRGRRRRPKPSEPTPAAAYGGGRSRSSRTALGTYGRRRQSSIDVVGRHVDARRLERRRVVIYQPL